MTLVELYEKGGQDTYPTDKGSVHSYLPVYDELFKQYQDKKINLIEIGYYKGGSMKLWEDYFPYAKIRGVDINPQNYEESNVVLGKRFTFIHKDVRALTSYDFKNFSPDIAIEDGSHQMRTQVRFIKTIYPCVRRGGLIIIEDFNCDKNWRHLNEMGIPYSYLDLRDVKGRADDFLIIIKK